MLSFRSNTTITSGLRLIGRALAVALFLSSTLASIAPTSIAAAPLPEPRSAPQPEPPIAPIPNPPTSTVQDPPAAPHFDGVASVSLSGLGNVPIGQNVNFTVNFDNVGTSPGYGPFIDVILDTTGTDGVFPGTSPNEYDGLGTPPQTITGTYLNPPIPVIAQDFFIRTFDGAGNATHPFARDIFGNFVIVTGTPGDTLVVVRLPFGSFTPGQPPAPVNFTVNMSNLADLGQPLSVQARGGFEFGRLNPLDDWCCGDSADVTLTPWVNGNVTPTLFTVSKSYSFLEAETATGPNFPREYTVSATIAPGQTMNPFTLTDELPDNIQFVAMVTPPAASCPTLPSTVTPGGTLTCNFGPASGTVDMTFTFYVPRLNASSGDVINPNTGDDATSCNQAQGSGTWAPIDTRDTGGSYSDPSTLTTDCNNPEFTLTPKSIAIQKFEDSGGPYVPGSTVEYRLEFQVSDFFVFDTLSIPDIISDGQSFDSSFTPTMRVDGNFFSLPAANMTNFTEVSNKVLTDGPPVPPGFFPGPELPASDGTTTVTFDVSAEIAARAVAELPATNPNETDARNHALAGRLLGGCVPLGGSASPDCSTWDQGPTQGTILFHAMIDEFFYDVYPSGDWSVDQGDILTNDVTVLGRVLETDSPFTPTGFTEIDDSNTEVSIATGSLSKEIYAINNEVCPGVTNCNTTPPTIKPGDTVTYRITYNMPTSDEENLQFVDYLPLPIFFVADPDADDVPAHSNGPAWVFDDAGQFGQPTVIPLPGHANFGPLDTFRDYSSIVPTFTPLPSAADNTITFFYGDFDDPANLPTTVDILFTLTVATEPFADGLYLTNQVRGSEGSTQNNNIDADDIVQLILTEPVLTSTKGVVWTSNPDNVFNPTPPAGVSFLPPGSSPRWGGVINSNGLLSNPIDSNVRDVDAQDVITFAITIENSGTSLKGAFDIILRDLLQTSYELPGTSTPLNLQIFYGNGAGPIAYTYNPFGGLCTGTWPGDPCGPDGIAGTADDLFGDGIQLVDPVGQGVCQAHDPNSGNNVIILTYDLRIATGVAPGNIVNTETLIRYAGDEGGPNHVPVPSPLTDQAIVTVSGAPAKFFFSTSEAHTSDSESGTVTPNDPRPVAVGEVIRYRIAARIPESTSVNFQVVDVLPSGLIFLDTPASFADVRIGFISDSNIASTGIGIIPAIPAACNLADIWHVPPTISTPADPLPCAMDDLNVGSSNSTASDVDNYLNGADIYFKLGDLVNGDTDDDGEFVVIDFNVLVHNLATSPAIRNDASEYRDNFVRTFAGSPLVRIGTDSPALRAVIVEPVLTLNKTHAVIGATVDAGDTVTYTITINNPGGPYTVDAFDVDFKDTLPAAFLTLLDTTVPANFNIALSGGAAGANNLSPTSPTPNTVWVTIDSMPINSQAVITYSASITIAVTPSQAIDNTGDLTWTSLPGPNGTGGATPGTPGSDTGERTGILPFPGTQPNDHVATITDTLNIDDPFFSKSLDSSSANHTIDPNLVIGEVATFGLFVTLPEGTTTSLQIVDDIPAGFAYIDSNYTFNLVTETNPPAVCGSLAADFAGTFTLGDPILTAPAAYTSGADLTFNFGTITVDGDNNPNNNSFLICFEAVVMNELGNPPTPPPPNLTNTGTMTVNLIDYTDDEVVTIVESNLQINKTVSDPFPFSGQVVTFTVQVTNPFTITAYDVLIFDDLPVGPPGLTLDLLSVSDVTAGLTAVANTSAGNRVEYSVGTFPPGGTITITYDATVNAPTGTPLNNVAEVRWTSLQGDTTVHPQERTGDDGLPGPGILNDYRDSTRVDLSTLKTLTKSLVTTNHFETVPPNVTIGEILTYEVQLTIPPNDTDQAIVVDTLDSGLAFVDCAPLVAGPDITSTTFAFAGGTAPCNHGTVAPNNPIISNSGRVITFDLGTVTNADTTNAQTLTLTYTVVVLDTVSNVRNVLLDNDVEWTWSAGRLSTNAGAVRIIEPDLGLEKTVAPDIAIPGSTITYTLRVFHTGATQTVAYDLEIFDVIPDNLFYVLGSFQNVSGVPGVVDETGINPVTGQGTLIVRWTSLDNLPPEESTISFQAIVPDQDFRRIVNVARLEWTSLPGIPPAYAGQPPGVQSQYNLASTERTYDPANPADIYGVTATSLLETPFIPSTGFAPGRTTRIPEQPAAQAYQDLGDIWIEIPSLGLQLPIVGIPVKDGDWDLTWLADNAGYLEGTAFPTRGGNSAITAHVYTPDGLPGPFVDLHNLRYGDQVIVHAFGQKYVYEVRSTLKVSPKTNAFKHEEYPWLTLITCQGYNPADDSYRFRIMVRAVQVRIEPE